MFFSLNYDDGYVIALTKMWDDGQIHIKPLRKFYEQGDAIAFREFDCPHLSETQIKMLVKQYNPNVKYRRINSKHFSKLTIKTQYYNETRRTDT